MIELFTLYGTTFVWNGDAVDWICLAVVVFLLATLVAIVLPHKRGE